MPSLLRKKKANESYVKYLFNLSHLWLGLLSSLVLIIVCLTGTILVFEQPIKDALTKEIRNIEVGSERVPLDVLKAKYTKQYGEENVRITVPAESNKAIHFFTFNRQTGERVSAYANPYTGDFAGEESETVITFFSNTLRMHRWLLVRGTGKAIVGISTIIFLFLLLSGIVLWWPKRWKQLKNGLKVKFKAKFYRLNYDLHSVVGFYSMIGLFFLGATGLYFAYPQVRNGVKATLGGEVVVQANGGHQHGPRNNQNAQNSLNTANSGRGGQAKGKRGNRAGNRTNPTILETGLAKVNQEFEYRSDVVITMPGRRSNGYKFQKYNRDNTLGAYLPEYIELNRRGKQINRQAYADLAMDQKVTSIMRPMHTGEIAGWPSMILYFILCIIGTSLPITGFVVWYKREAKARVKSDSHRMNRKSQLQQI